MNIHAPMPGEGNCDYRRDHFKQIVLRQTNDV
jgi:hypothetical protein